MATFLGQALGWYRAGEGAGLDRRRGWRRLSFCLFMAWSQDVDALSDGVQFEQWTI